MSEDLVNEVEAIRSIYSQDTLREADDAFVYILSVPYREASLRVSFPPDYPESIPRLLGIEETGPHARKGYGSHVLDTARAILVSVFIPGSVCLFDLLQELNITLTEDFSHQQPSSSNSEADESLVSNATPSDTCGLGEEPCWILSLPVSEKKSTFVARACTVTSPAQAHASIAHLGSDKRAAKASHHISAYRIRATSIETKGEIVYQDFDDDGENAAGGRLLRLLQAMNVWDVLVVVSRWYGGVKLGPNRFNIINNVAREALVKGGWTKSRIKNGALDASSSETLALGKTTLLPSIVPIKSPTESANAVAKLPTLPNNAMAAAKSSLALAEIFTCRVPNSTIKLHVTTTKPIDGRTLGNTLPGIHEYINNQIALHGDGPLGPEDDPFVWQSSGPLHKLATGLVTNKKPLKLTVESMPGENMTWGVLLIAVEGLYLYLPAVARILERNLRSVIARIKRNGGLEK